MAWMTQYHGVSMCQVLFAFKSTNLFTHPLKRMPGSAEMCIRFRQQCDCIPWPAEFLNIPRDNHRANCFTFHSFGAIDSARVNQISLEPVIALLLLDSAHVTLVGFKFHCVPGTRLLLPASAHCQGRIRT